VRQSNTYIIVFSAILTIILGGLLSGASVILKPFQDKQIELDTKKKILGAVMDISNIKDSNEILALYDKRVKSIVVDIKGVPLEKDAKGNPMIAEKIDFQKNNNKYKYNPEDRPYPVFMFINEAGKVEAYIFPMFGAGLWDWISGFIALEADLNTVKGVAFDHKSETPGLGARITSEVITSRYVGKKVFDANGALQSVSMVKGEKGLPLDDHHVDGMSGATLTGKGVNAMLKNYLGFYQTYIERVKSEAGATTLVDDASITEENI